MLRALKSPKDPAPPVWLRTRGDIGAALDALSIHRGRPVLVLVGGAGGMDDDDVQRLSAVLRIAVVPIIEMLHAAAIDGGTDSGVMRAMGRARAEAGASFPLIGVAAAGTVSFAAVPPADRARLDPHHTHVLLVPGSLWGDESPWIAAVADVVAQDHPSVTLLANGGDVSSADVERSLQRRRPVIVLSGTGRAADAIGEAAATGQAGDMRVQAIAGSPLTRIVSVGSADQVRSAVQAALEAVVGGFARNTGPSIEGR
ncbi:hypothetical protein [Lapillicoccus sp.]|uniref:hypothetical protein n=1 Tax=Lapillicoccus sp. TaxID=1909287 RepID=UPI00387E5918